MKIIGKLHDYYDGLMSYGQDESLIFKREAIEFKGNDPIVQEVEHLLQIDTFLRGHWRDHFSFPQTDNLESGDGVRHKASAIFVGFCGKMYMGFEVVPQSHWTYSHHITQHSTKFVYSTFDAQKLEKSYSLLAHQGRTEIPWLTNMMNHHSQNVSKIDVSDFMIKHKIPYFVAKTRNRIISEVHFVPELKKYEFQKVKDPYIAYQEISMFLGGVIPRQLPEIVGISDKDRIAQHGFDKLSFRHPFKIKKEKK